MARRSPLPSPSAFLTRSLACGVGLPAWLIDAEARRLAEANPLPVPERITERLVQPVAEAPAPYPRPYTF